MDEKKRSVEVSRGLAELRDFVLGFLAIPAGMIFMALQYRPDTPSVGYAPWLKSHGVQQPWADAMAGLLVRRGARIENDSRWMPSALRAIRALGRRRINRADDARHVGLLLAAWEKSSAIETIFSEMCLDEFEFIHALKTAKSDDKPALDRVKEIARTISPRIQGRRGPKISAPSVAHEFFLGEVAHRFHEGSYTWNETQSRFSDPITEATRKEFGLQAFDPRPALRRARQRGNRRE